MGLRRFALLLFGVMGGMLSAAALYVSCTIAPNAQAVTPQQQTPVRVQQITALPAAVPGTSLIVQRLSSYDGPFLEDGSDREVVGIAAILVYNGGSCDLSAAYVCLDFSDASYHFSGEYIPAGAMAVLLEREEKAYRSDTPIQCTGWQTVSHAADGANQVAVTELAGGALEIQNLTDSVLRNIRIYYKSWLSPPDIYVGGIAYSMTVPVLMPKQCLTIYPGHYAPGYSKVVSVLVDL